jgi:hypothetical protein
MVRSEVADGGGGVQKRRVAINVLIKLSQTANQG